MVVPEDQRFLVKLVDARSGGGSGGEGGAGGKGGRGGRGGQGLFDADNHPCADGSEGASGSDGLSGPSGVSGFSWPGTAVVTVPAGSTGLDDHRLDRVRQ